jgi:hypothetical protein
MHVAAAWSSNAPARVRTRAQPALAFGLTAIGLAFAAPVLVLSWPLVGSSPTWETPHGVERDR